MTQELIIAVLLLGLTGIVWTVTLATFTKDQPPRKNPGVISNLPEHAVFPQSKGSIHPSQAEN